MLTSESYKQLSDRCAQIAITSSAPSVAQALMALAFDYLTRANEIASPAMGQQRQQEPIDGFGD
jgi:hypothetical protein